MYADRVTTAMQRAISETDRRRGAQEAFNVAHGITPKSIIKGVSDITQLLGLSETVPFKEKRRLGRSGEALTEEEMERLMTTLEEEMFAAAEELRFEYAAALRDEIKGLARDLQRLRS